MKTSIYILHGWAIDAENEVKWQKLRTLLKAKQIDTHFLAIPGLSTPLSDVWTLTDYVNWLKTQLPKEKVILLGHSFGGQLASRFTSLYPEKVAKLILIGAAGIRNNRPWPVLKRQIFYYLAKIGKIFTNQALAKRLLYKLAREQDYFVASPNMKLTMRNVLADEVKTDLSKISCPTLLIWGQRDTYTPLWMGHFYHQQIAHSRLEILASAKHSPQFTHPEQVANLIESFI